MNARSQAARPSDEAVEAQIYGWPQLLEAILHTVGISILTGLARFLVTSFVVGIQGMLVGGLSGAIAGQLMQSRPSMINTFGQRVRLALILSVAYLFGQWIGAGLALPGFDPLFLLEAILQDDLREVVTGTSVNSYTSFQEPVDPFWWSIFMILDTGLFAFLAMASINVFAGSPEELPRAGERSSPPSPVGRQRPRLRLPARIYGLVFFAGWAFLWFNSADTIARNQRGLKRWYEESWAHQTMLELRLQLPSYPVSVTSRETVDRILAEALSGRHSFPEGYAIEAALLVRERKLEEALRRLETGEAGAETMGRSIKVHILGEAPPQLLRAHLAEARGRILWELDRLAEAELAFGRAIKIRNKLQHRPPQALFPVIPAGAVPGQGDLFPLQSQFYAEARLPGGFGLKSAFLSRAALRDLRGDLPGAEADRVAASQIPE